MDGLIFSQKIHHVCVGCPGCPGVGAVLLAAQLCGRGTRGPKRLGLGGNDLREPRVMGRWRWANLAT